MAVIHNLATLHQQATSPSSRKQRAPTVSTYKNASNGLEPQPGTQGVPGYPAGYQPLQTGYPQQAFQQFTPTANPYTAQPMAAQTYPQAMPQQAADPHRGEQPFVPSFVEAATYNED